MDIFLKVDRIHGTACKKKRLKEKEDVKEVKSGTECGIGVKDYNDIKTGDQIEVYKRTEVSRSV